MQTRFQGDVKYLRHLFDQELYQNGLRHLKVLLKNVY